MTSMTNLVEGRWQSRISLSKSGYAITSLRKQIIPLLSVNSSRLRDSSPRSSAITKMNGQMELIRSDASCKTWRNCAIKMRQSSSLDLIKLEIDHFLFRERFASDGSWTSISQDQDRGLLSAQVYSLSSLQKESLVSSDLLADLQTYDYTYGWQSRIGVSQQGGWHLKGIRRNPDPRKIVPPQSVKDQRVAAWEQAVWQGKEFSVPTPPPEQRWHDV